MRQNGDIGIGMHRNAHGTLKSKDLPRLPSNSDRDPAPVQSRYNSHLRLETVSTQTPGGHIFPSSAQQPTSKFPSTFPAVPHHATQADALRTLDKPVHRYEPKEAAQLRGSFVRSRVDTKKASAQRLARGNKSLRNVFRPGIKVDTSFLRGHQNVPRQLFPQSETLPAKEELVGNQNVHNQVQLPSLGAFISLGDLEGLDVAQRHHKGVGQKKSKPVGQNGRFEYESWEKSGSPRTKEKKARRMERASVASKFATASRIIEQGSRNGNHTPTLRQSRNKNKDLTPTSQIISGISPSDRPIPIGLSISPQKQVAFGIVQPVDAITTDHRVIDYETQQNDEGVVTPTILITPAKEGSGWASSPEVGSFTQRHKPRPPSSIYSQATAYPRDSPSSEIIPPIPPIPAGITGVLRKRSSSDIKQRSEFTGAAKSVRMSGFLEKLRTRDSTGTLFEEDDENQPSSRILSTATLIEEEGTPQTATAQLARPMKNLKLDTFIPSPRRSRGWWNVITTPFELRQSGLWSPLASPRNLEKTKEPQNLNAAAAIGFSPCMRIFLANSNSAVRRSHRRYICRSEWF
jgi:hypothetical protein